MLRRLAIAIATTATVSLAFAAPAVACDESCPCGKNDAKAETADAEPAQESDDAKAENELASQPGADVGDKTICPVMGSVFKVSENSPSAEHDGKKVYFCCAGCGDQFAEDPEGLLASVNEKIAERNAE